MIALFGAFGALCRYGLVNLIGGTTFPYGTFIVNIVGSFMMGVAYVLIVEKMILPPSLKPIFMTGFLGAFTTFSAFSLESWELLDRGEPFLAFTYIAGSVIFCIVALFMSIFVARASF